MVNPEWSRRADRTRYDGGFCHRVRAAGHRGVRGVVPPGDYCALVKEELRAAGYDLAFS